MFAMTRDYVRDAIGRFAFASGSSGGSSTHTHHAPEGPALAIGLNRTFRDANGRRVTVNGHELHSSRSDGTVARALPDGSVEFTTRHGSAERVVTIKPSDQVKVEVQGSNSGKTMDQMIRNRISDRTTSTSDAAAVDAQARREQARKSAAASGKHSPIPGNLYPEVKIYPDTTLSYLEDRLKKITGAQQANLRNNPRYVRHVQELKRAIERRKKT